MVKGAIIVAGAHELGSLRVSKVRYEQLLFGWVGIVLGIVAIVQFLQQIVVGFQTLRHY
jgi:hypothetical protein